MRMRVENPGTKGGSKMAKKKTTGKKKSKSKGNPKKKRTEAQKAATRRMIAANKRKSNPKRKKSSSKKKSSSASSSKRSSGKKKSKSNPGKKKKGSPRRRNPEWSKVTTVLEGMAIAAVSAVASSWFNAGPFGRQPPMIQSGIQLLEIAAVMYWVENPAYAVAGAIGIGLVPCGNVVYRAFPGLMSPPRGVALPPVMAGGPGTPATMGALHARQRTIASLQRMDRKIAALHSGKIGALHRTIRALHRGQPMIRALHADIGALQMVSESPADQPMRGVFDRYN